MRPILLMLVLLPPFACAADMLTPAYYDGGAMSREADAFLAACQEVQMQHPLENSEGEVPAYDAPRWGAFGAGKGPTRAEQHHAATDLKVGGGQTDVELFAAYDGVVATVRDAPKYRHYISITKIITDPETDRILGIAVAGPGAGELIAEGVLAMEMAAVSEDLRRTIHPHPTLSETVYEAAQSLFKP